MTRKYTLVAGFAAAFMLPSLGNAQPDIANTWCSDHLYAVLQRDLKIPSSIEVLAESCKQWVHDPNLMLAAVAFDAGVADQKRLVVAIINRTTMRVVSSYDQVSHDGSTKEEREEWGGYGRLEIDTARYQLARDVRAFALRFDRRRFRTSCADLRSSNELTLLVPEGQKLRPVLAIYMQQERALEGCLGTGRLDKNIDEGADLTIGIEKTSTNGFHDLSIAARITTTYESSGSDPVSREHLERRALRYDGNAYRLSSPAPLPWWFVSIR